MAVPEVLGDHRAEACKDLHCRQIHYLVSRYLGELTMASTGDAFPSTAGGETAV